MIQCLQNTHVYPSKLACFGFRLNDRLVEKNTTFRLQIYKYEIIQISTFLGKNNLVTRSVSNIRGLFSRIIANKLAPADIIYCPIDLFCCHYADVLLNLLKTAL